MLNLNVVVQEMYFCIHSGHAGVVRGAVRVTPKFPNKGQNLTEVPLMFINSGKFSDCTTLLEVTSRTSVLFSFILEFVR